MCALPARTVTKYENNLMLSHEGKLLSTSSSKRLDWYLIRELADEIFDYPDKRYPRVIKLRFPTEGDNKSPLVSDVQAIENRCVVCGVTTDLTRHHAVPYRVKRTYRAADKEFTRSQCVLLCGPHHEAAELAAATLNDPFRGQPPWSDKVVRAVSYVLYLIHRVYRRYWVWRHGGVKGVNRRFIEAFMTLKPRYLPEGWLQP